MRNEAKRINTWRECLARQVGGCSLTARQCLRCGAVRQALRAAASVQCRWPNLAPRRPG
jgi:hypothetical protein